MCLACLVAARAELEAEKRLAEGAAWRWGEPADQACQMGGTGWYRQVTITEKEGGVERKTNLTLPSYVWVGLRRPIVHPIVLAKKGVLGGVLRMVQMGVQICIFSSGWALQSLDQPCKSFLAPILHVLDLWALQSPGYKLYPLYLPPVHHVAPVYSGQVATLHGAGLSGILSSTL